MDELATLTTLEASLRAAGAHERETVALPHFEAFLSPSRDYLLNFAVPLLPDPIDWTFSVQSLVELFANHQRRPRLEYFHELHPHLAAALERSGFAQESQAPVMMLRAEALLSAETPADIEYQRLVGNDEAILRTFLTKQSVAYGGAEDESAWGWLPSLRSGLHSGNVMAATLMRKGEFLAGASIQIGGGIGELAGVWTLPAARRQGLARAVCQRLLSDYFAAGHALCWLSAAEGALRLYELLGFKRVGTQLNYGVGNDEKQ